MNPNQSPPQVEFESDGHLGGVADRFLERLAERLGGKASVAAVYGTPVERDGVTVIPVAKVRWGFGGGSGRGRNRQDDATGEGSGAGGGGGVAASPLGYIELAGGKTEFRRISDTSALLPVVPLVLATGVSLFLMLSGVGRLRRSPRALPALRLAGRVSDLASRKRSLLAG